MHYRYWIARAVSMCIIYLRHASISIHVYRTIFLPLALLNMFIYFLFVRNPVQKSAAYTIIDCFKKKVLFYVYSELTIPLSLCISLCQAGLVTTLSTKTIVFGATNPKGQYDPDQCNTYIQKILLVGFIGLDYGFLIMHICHLWKTINFQFLELLGISNGDHYCYSEILACKKHISSKIVVAQLIPNFILLFSSCSSVCQYCTLWSLIEQI